MTISILKLNGLKNNLSDLNMNQTHLSYPPTIHIRISIPWCLSLWIQTNSWRAIFSLIDQKDYQSLEKRVGQIVMNIIQQYACMV